MHNEITNSPEAGQGDRGERFMSLYVAIQRRLYGYVISMIPDESAVDDIIQETASVMWRHFDEFESGTDFAAWSIAIARNRIYSHIKHKHKLKRSFTPLTLQCIEKMAETRKADEDQRLDVLRQCIHKLSQHDRQLLILRYEIDATVKSVSQRVGLSLNTIYNRLYRIRIMLMHCVEIALKRQET